MKIVEEMVGRARDAGARARTEISTTTLGVVTDNCDPEGLARVRCKYPLFADDLMGAWAPLVAPGAGPQSGWFFLPNVGDEVLVAFEHDDINRPVVLGMLWSAQRPPPHDAADAESSLLTLASNEKGARIEFDDKADEIRLFAPGDKTTMTLSKDGITIKTDGDVALTSMQGRVVIAGKEVELVASTTLTATGMQEIAVIGSSEVKITGKPSIQAAAPQLTFGGTVSASSSAAAKNEVIADPLG